MALYLMNIYGDEKSQRWFVDGYKKSGKKADIGKSYVRFKKVEDLPLDLVAKAVTQNSVSEFISMYEQSRIR